MLEDIEYEKNKLSNVLKIVNKIIKIEETDLKKLEKSSVTNEDLWLREISRKKVHLSNLEYAQEKPYFARIDFVSDLGESVIIYIGKNGIIHNNNVIITDWRAPISSLYYNSSKGKTSYFSPNGEIVGEMLLKRQFEIEKGKLNSYIDVDIVSSDLLLQKYLSSNNNDARLKNIVSTIQKEQNDVIRKDLYKNIIIQGVAGSGKTTVALHRIAYLIYNYKTYGIMQNQYLIIGPNPVFLKYIKQVLPELDVDSVRQYTFETFVEKYINEKLKMKSSDKKLNDSIEGKIVYDIDKFKCSKKYKGMLDVFYDYYIENLTQKDLLLGEFKVLSSDEIKKIFSSVLDDYKGNCLTIIIEQASYRLEKYIKNNYSKIMDRYFEFEFEMFGKASSEDKGKLKSVFINYKKEIGKFCKSLIKKYFVKLNTSRLYKLFINNIDKFNIYNYGNLFKLKEDTLNNLKKNIFEFEDLAALLYLKSKVDLNIEFSNIEGFGSIKHVVIDEAQDLGEFNFIALKEVLPDATFSIFGDLAQSIYDYRGVDSWNLLNVLMFNGSAEIVNFNKSYRTTAEIMNVADNVVEYIGLNRSDLVVRHGSPVEFINISIKEVPNYILRRIDILKKMGYKSIAIISKTVQDSLDINKKLNKISGYKIFNVDKDADISNEEFNICTISNQLVKGLEFDCVIINNVSEKKYSSSLSLDMKLLYVALTRALHKLDIIYDRDISLPLSGYIKK